MTTRPGCEPCGRDGVQTDPVAERFASRSVPAHLARGLLGLLLVVLALGLAGRNPAALLLLVPAVVAWRGCPTCWLLGLGETRRRAGRTGRADRGGTQWSGGRTWG